MSTDKPVDEAADLLVVAMGNGVERALRKIARLDDDVRRLAQDVNALQVGSDGQTAAPGPAEVRAWLLAAEPEQAVLDLIDLGRSGQRGLPAIPRRRPCPRAGCGTRYVIEELWWLRCAHADAIHPETGSWLRVGDGTTANDPASRSGSGRR